MSWSNIWPASFLADLLWRPNWRHIRLGGQGGLYHAVVDADQYAELAKYKWTALKKRDRVVAVRCAKNYLTGKWHVVYMHRLIAGTPPDQTCDHKNGDSLDNRRRNLENVTDEENNTRKHARRRAA